MSHSCDTPVKQAYNLWAERYDSADNKTRDLDAKCLMQAGLELSGKSVVEFGAGTGKNTAFLARHAAQVIAMDLSPGMLEQARGRQLGAHVQFLEHDVTTAWPVETGSADLVIGNLVLEHIEVLAPVIDEAARVLRPGGLVYLAELHPFRQLRGSQARFEQADGSELHIDAWYHGVADYCAAARKAGFQLADLREPADTGLTVGAATVPRLLVMQFVKTG